MSTEFDLKTIFNNEQKYNNIKLLESSIFENIVCIKLELLTHSKKDELQSELEFINKFLDFYYKFITYTFCKENMITRFKLECNTDECLKDATLTELFQTLYDKINLIIDEMMGDIDYNPKRVTIGKKTSVFLIAYATELKELWEFFNEEFIQNLMNKNLENKVFRSEYFSDKLKVIQVANLKGAWANKSLNFK
jgi:hypothetical protein